MRYGVFSDVHANLEALTAVLDFYRGQAIDRYAFVGDAVGYGASPNDVCDLLRPLLSNCVVGNHDAAATDRMEPDDYYEAARHALTWCRDQLSRENFDWLARAPYKEVIDAVQFCHGSPLVPEHFEYVFAVEQVADLLVQNDDLPQVTFIGHSHLTISFRIFDRQITPMVMPKIDLDPDAKYIITVGSVGQPRDRDPRACCGLYDTEARTFTFHRIQYDISKARQRIIDAGLSPVFGERLMVGI
jgi:diadenosine tetraphosphatase ApaH/serine/threonine PP2A family protein phosphatase